MNDFASLRRATFSKAHSKDSLPSLSVPDGTLFVISSLGWGVNYRSPEDGDSRDEYSLPPISTEPKRPYISAVFCSKTRPLIFNFFEGKWSSTALRPGDDAAVSGADESAYSEYWAACHHFFPKSAFDPLVHKLAPKLGYRFSGGFPENGMENAITQPSDLMK